MTKLLAVVFGALLWLALFMGLYHAAAESLDGPPVEPPRVITIITGYPSDYAVLATESRLVFTLTMVLKPDGYRAVERFGRCATGCRLRVYIVQEGS